jgi:hypothetical protein
LRYGHRRSPGRLFSSGSPSALPLGCPAGSGSPTGSRRSPVGFHAAAPTPRAPLVPASPPVHRTVVVSDYQPIVHRLRRNASGLGPTNPTRMFLPSETLGLRRTRFSRALSLLIPAFALRSTPGALPGRPSPRPNAPLPRPLRDIHGFGARLEPRSIVGAGTLDQ